MKKRSLNLLIAGILYVAAPLAATASTVAAADSTTGRPAPAFNLKDLNGKTVKLSDYKGKVLIIDFWASWCVPCHESFPAMQKVLEHYKNSPEVAFLFINTREKTDAPQKAAAADMKKNHYDFPVAIDERGADGLQNKYYKEFGMIGIPTQFIIDQGGTIRYKVEGYDSRKTDDQAAADLIKSIDQLKSPAAAGR